MMIDDDNDGCDDEKDDGFHDEDGNWKTDLVSRKSFN